MMTMQGVIRYGNYTNDPEVRPLKIVELTGDAEIHYKEGNWTHARVRTNGFTFSDPHGRAKGLYLDEGGGFIKQDDYEYNVTEPFDKATQILAALERGGEDALCAYEEIVDALQADTAPLMDMQEFVAAYSALAVDNLTYSANLLKKLAVAVMGQEWTDGKTNEQIFLAAQSFIRGKTKDQLMGLDTELVRVVA